MVRFPGFNSPLLVPRTGEHHAVRQAAAEHEKLSPTEHD